MTDHETGDLADASDPAARHSHHMPHGSTNGKHPEEDLPVCDAASIVERYFNVAADLAAPADALLSVLHPEVRIIEHPNAINPRGSIRDRDDAVTAFLAGKRLLATQAIELRETLVSGSRVVVRATWRGIIGQEVAGLPAGTELVAHIAGVLTVEDGRVREHETFDCYERWPQSSRLS